MKRKSIYREAEKVVGGPRRKAYGEVRASFERCAAVWSAVLGTRVTGHQVALCMIGLKLCREANAPGYDNRLDMIGYAGLAEELGREVRR